MTETNSILIVIETVVNKPIADVWTYWTEPQHITHWNSASDDWSTPRVENDLRPGGRFVFRMEAIDGFGFDFCGVYNDVKIHDSIVYTIGDNRKVQVVFTPQGQQTKIVETFEAEHIYSVEKQKDGWQAILNHFKRYAESQA